LPEEKKLAADQLEDCAASDDPFIRQAVVARLAGNQFLLLLGEINGVEWDELAPRQRLCGLQLFRWFDKGEKDPFTGQDSRIEPLRRILREEVDPDMRLYAVRWVADERIAELRDDVAKLLDGEMPTERYFLCVLAAIEWLDGDASPRTGGISDGLLRRELANSKRSPQIKALALRLISPDHEWLTIDRLREYLASDAPELHLEAVRTLAMQTRPERLGMLAEIAGDDALDAELRAEAVVGLAPAVGEYGKLLEKLAAGDDVVAKEAARVLRLSRKRTVEPEAGQRQRPELNDLDGWNALLKDGGDAASGRRLFFTNQALCAVCHQHGGRGGRVGPDLTRIGEQQSRERIIASILQPSREIAPHYQAWQLVTTDGLSHEGLRLPEGGDDGTEPYADVQGRRFELRSEDIELRSPSQASIMPEGLAELLTIDDLRDLVAFLAGPRSTVEGSASQP
jgi:putative heme-binding domain-containing protein